jgi:hypothetical protein
MHCEAVQLSHEELLVTLALLELPAPLALGPRPSAAYDPAALGAALAAALGGLAARGLVAGPAGSLPAPVEPLASLARAAALADRCLVVAERRADGQSAAHLSAHGGSLVLHTSPAPRVHRLAPLADLGAAVGWLADTIGPAPDAPLPAVEAPAEALAGALDALAAGMPEAAVAILVAAGVPETAAGPFLAALGPCHVRLALGAVEGLRAESPSSAGALVVAGAGGAWWADAGPPGAPLCLRPVGPAELRDELQGLAAPLAGL